MKFVVEVKIPNEQFNQQVRDGSVGRNMGRILEETHPEAVYFLERDGQRSALVICDLADTSQIPKIAEPWFLGFNATVQFRPAMTPDDLKRSGLEQIGKKWG